MLVETGVDLFEASKLGNFGRFTVSTCVALGASES